VRGIGWPLGLGRTEDRSPLGLKSHVPTVTGFIDTYRAGYVEGRGVEKGRRREGT